MPPQNTVYDVSLHILPTSRVVINGDGNCFFRSVSWYMTGSEDQHSEVRQLMINHVMRNYEAIKAFSGKSEEDFREWICNKASTSGSVKHEDTHWADEDRTIRWADRLHGNYVIPFQNNHIFLCSSDEF